MKIGIIGCGIVGGACKFGFEKLGHEVIVHDPKFNTIIQNILDTTLSFISVPTPQSTDGSCDISIVESVILELKKINYKGVICIKSTVIPGTTRRLIEETGLPICFVPEFLRERCAISDFVENHKLLAVGTTNEDCYKLVVSCHGAYPQHTKMLTPDEAELLKYCHNAFNALRIIFANEFYEVCNQFNSNYSEIKNCLLLTSEVPDKYLDVNNNMRGYSGTCLPKDVSAMKKLVKELGLNIKLFDYIDDANSKLKKTVFPNMRL